MSAIWFYGRHFCDGVSEDKHQRSRRNQQAAGDSFYCYRFAKDEESHDHGDDYAELVYGNDFAGIADLQSVKIAEPGQAGCQAAEDKEKPAAAADIGNLLLPACGKDDAPGHYQDDERTDGSRKVGVYPRNAYLGKNRCERCKNSG